MGAIFKDGVYLTLGRSTPILANCEEIKPLGDVYTIKTVEKSVKTYGLGGDLKLHEVDITNVPKEVLGLRTYEITFANGLVIRCGDSTFFMEDSDGGWINASNMNEYTNIILIRYNETDPDTIVTDMLKVQSVEIVMSPEVLYQIKIDEGTNILIPHAIVNENDETELQFIIIRQ